MQPDEIYKVVRELVGPIRPIGETNEDNKRFANLRVMCAIMDAIHSDVDAVAFDFRNYHEASIKKANEYAKVFLEKITIKE